ncbi:ABC transporter permease [Nocardiopsis quinghaiensis]|uniref:ABC transporter permease n=1 Tax=Nocardiopsis quinghaiensis TaxID=464995 RepID=UPI001CC229F9|nr:ABC transporter permease [Nocardiopsis quinghaiensis]
MSPSAARLRASPLFWPLPPVLVLVPAGLILAMTLAGTWGQLGWRALDWVYLSSQVGAQARLPAVVAAGAAALVAGRFTRRSLVFAQPWQPRVERDVPLRHAVVVVGWCLGAYLVGLLPLTGAVATRGAGSPDAAAVAGALAGFVSLTLLGYLCGVVARGLLAVPVAVGTVFLLTSLVFVSDSWTALSLRLPFDPFLGMREAAALGPYRLGFFLLLTVAVAWTVLWLLRTPRRFSAVHGVAVAAVAVTMVLPHLRPFPLVTRAPGPAVCDERGGVRYCVHEGHAEELTAVTGLAAPVFDAYGPTDALPREVRDQSLSRGDEEVLDGPGQDVLWLPVYPGWDPYQQVPAAAAEWVAPDVDRCGSGSVASLDHNAEPEERRAAVVYGLKAWLASQAFEGDAYGNDLFADADPEQVRAWIRQDRERLVSCEVDPEELPWRT